ncbi:hypothetical protein L1987_71172 [Smallanthus sonchifolius]|uniref:Uncharacterized protein n=1 Tax=Smallanthus sonchifolius TaxID=185202 RepID=A0ACB9AQX3_9ASTR|nr:hypothetical protein L1987_71172 [Smallanthus sonchifolius]
MKALTLVSLSFSSSCLWILLVLSLCDVCFCDRNSDPVVCIPTERLALIDLKNNLTDRANRLSSWVGKDSCSWSSVVCDNFTSHVHEIRLGGHDDKFPDYCYEFDDTDSECNFTSLIVLDLSYNNFDSMLLSGWIFSLRNLALLDLTDCGNQIVEEMPKYLSNHCNFTTLDLRYNKFFWECVGAS